MYDILPWFQCVDLTHCHGSWSILMWFYWLIIIEWWGVIQIYSRHESEVYFTWWLVINDTHVWYFTMISMCGSHTLSWILINSDVILLMNHYKMMRCDSEHVCLLSWSKSESCFTEWVVPNEYTYVVFSHDLNLLIL